MKIHIETNYEVKAKSLPYSYKRFYEKNSIVSHTSLLINPQVVDQVSYAKQACYAVLEALAQNTSIAAFVKDKLPYVFSGSKDCIAWAESTIDHTYWYFSEPAFFVNDSRVLIVVYGDGGLIDISCAPEHAQSVFQKVSHALKDSNV